MGDEIKALKSLMTGGRPLPLGAGTVIPGTWGRLPLLLVRTGIGPAAAADTLRRLLAEYTPAFCLQVGYAGGVRPDQEPGDLVIATVLIDAGAGRSYEVEPSLVRRAELLRRRLALPGRSGPLVTLAQPALTPEEKAAQAPQAVAVEMESAVFAEACKNAGLPFLVVRTVLDPLNFHLPQPDQNKPPRPNPFQSPPLSDFADRARRSLTAFAAAWLDNISGQWPLTTVL